MSTAHIHPKARRNHRQAVTLLQSRERDLRNTQVIIEMYRFLFCGVNSTMAGCCRNAHERRKLILSWEQREGGCGGRLFTSLLSELGIKELILKVTVQAAPAPFLSWTQLREAQVNYKMLTVDLLAFLHSQLLNVERQM